MSMRGVGGLLVGLLTLAGCSNVRYLPAGEALYTGATVKVTGTSKSTAKALAGELASLTRPRPNTSVLGLRPKLWVYNLAGKPKSTKGLRHWLRTKVGEPPVLMSSVSAERNRQLLQNRLQNEGYLNATVTADTTVRNRRGTVAYVAQPAQQYHFRYLTYPTDSSVLARAIAQTAAASLLRPGQPYRLAAVEAERRRIDQLLKEQGFYYFNPDHLLLRVDSTVGDHRVDAFLTVKPGVPAKARQVWRINNVFIYPNYALDAKAADTLTKPTRQGDFYLVDNQGEFRPRVFRRMIFFHPSEVYNRTDHNLALNRLINLGTFRFVKNRFAEADSAARDTALAANVPALDVHYYLTAAPRKSLRLELLGKTNSANFTGGELNLSWRNRNALRGAELLAVSAYGGAEVQFGGLNDGYNIFRAGGEASLTLPRLLTPIRFRTPRAFVPRTRALLGYEYQYRQRLYSFNTLRASLGYLWREDVRKEHQFNVVNITYANNANVTTEYQTRAAQDPTLARLIAQQLIFGPTYAFTFTNTMESSRRHTVYYNAQVELAGNVAGWLSGASAREGQVRTLLGVPFSQFVRLENDFRHYLKTGPNGQLASRAIVGVGLPLGNSLELPFIRQFFVGGTNSLRAFRARSVGPGTYRNPTTDGTAFLPDQSGDLKLELNVEYRAKLFSIVRGAAFVDAGNVWLVNDKDGRAGGQFSRNFLSELAVGTGLGLRFDLSILVLRTDLAFPIRKPWLPEGQRWTFGQVAFGDPAWRRENLVFNLAIGYPF